MRVSILQTDINWGKPSVNQLNAEKIIDGLPQTDLIVLPETWSTGFAVNPEGIAENEGKDKACDSARWMKRIAQERNIAICGSISVKTTENTYANRMYFVYPDGTVETYDKRHLFTPGGENLKYTTGKKRCIAEYCGTRFLLQICYDLRFPVWTRNKGDYDAIIYVANWPKSRHDVWTTLLKARAIENQCYVIGVNRVGEDKSCKYAGGSIIVNPYGKTVCQCEDNVKSCATGNIEMLMLEKFRESFPVLDDADIFSINAGL